jgi:ABC-type glycerol-3-phosphate transport system substrate-binding protein
MDYDTYISKLISGDDEVDIFCVYSNQLAEYGRQGYLMPLNDVPSIMDELHKAEWVPFEKHFSDGGKLYCVPVNINYRLFQVDSYMARQSGFEMPKPPYSWRDLYEAAAKARLGQPGQPALMYDLSVNPYLIHQYTMAKFNREGRVNYDTTVFREDMEAYRQMVEENMVVLLELGDAATSVILNNTWEIGADAALMPAVDGQDSVEVSCYGFGVNQNSQNKALAIEFLAEYLKPEHQYKTKYGETNAMLLKGAGLYDHTPYGGPNAPENSVPWGREELWKYTMDKWIFMNTDLLMGNIIAGTDVVKRYVEGGITLDELIGILQYKADLIQNR